MGATFSVTPICEHAAVVRRHPGGGGYGDPYDWCCTVTAAGEIQGVAHMTDFTHSDARELLRTLAARGYPRVWWERRKGGRATVRAYGADPKGGGGP